MEPWRAYSQIRKILMRNRVQSWGIEVKSRIRIRVEVKSLFRIQIRRFYSQIRKILLRNRVQSWGIEVKSTIRIRIEVKSLFRIQIRIR